MKNLLFEVLTEEIPARFIDLAVTNLKLLAESNLKDYRLRFHKVITGATPRRLTLFVENLAEKQEDLEEEVLGPPAKVALDENGEHTKAALGFANKHGALPSELYLKETPKGTYLALKVKQKGEETAKLLPQILTKILTELPFPKKMIWGERRFPFARPIRSLLCLWGDEVLEFTIAGLKTSNFTYGHRFLSKEPLTLRQASWEEYYHLLKENWVILLPEERKKMTEEAVFRVCKGKGIPEIEPSLLEENANLVEYPFTILGFFDPKFLRLPKELIKASLQEHQRYFLLRDTKGELLNLFVSVNNNRVREERVLQEGHERVAKARLEDALFYYERDLKHSMDEWVEALKGIVYHVKCGTLYQKMERLKALAKELAKPLNLTSGLTSLERACHYAKADLASEVVKEFPSLQGIMGKHYYQIQFKEEEVAQAILEQYYPLPGGEELPQTVPGLILSLCDKIDHLCALIGVEERSTGESDPFGLRRAVFGLIKIIIGKELNLELRPILIKACDLLKKQNYLKNPNTLEEAENFIRKRLETEFLNQGFPKSLIHTVLSKSLNPYEQFLKLKVLKELQETSRFEDLLTSFKRIYLILKNQDLAKISSLYPEKFQTEEERALFSWYHTHSQDYYRFLHDVKDYRKALELLATLRPLVDRFFEEVFVMVEDEVIKNNRLALLNKIYLLFHEFGDFEHLL